MAWFWELGMCEEAQQTGMEAFVWEVDKLSGHGRMSLLSSVI